LPAPQIGDRVCYKAENFMENPFVYGRYVTGAACTDREEELAYLVRELESNGRIF
jgi:hypothetical protein